MNYTWYNILMHRQVYNKNFGLKQHTLLLKSAIAKAQEYEVSFKTN